MIASGSPFLGRLTCLIAANSQLKHGMRYGGCPVAKFQTWKEGWQWKGSHLLSLVTLVLSRGYFPHLQCYSPSFLHAQVFSTFTIISNESQACFFWPLHSHKHRPLSKKCLDPSLHQNNNYSYKSG